MDVFLSEVLQQIKDSSNGLKLKLCMMHLFPTNI